MGPHPGTHLEAEPKRARVRALIDHRARNLRAPMRKQAIVDAEFPGDDEHTQRSDDHQNGYVGDQAAEEAAYDNR
jgi:hypothetical protein